MPILCYLVCVIQALKENVGLIKWQHLFYLSFSPDWYAYTMCLHILVACANNLVSNQWFAYSLHRSLRTFDGILSINKIWRVPSNQNTIHTYIRITNRKRNACRMSTFDAMLSDERENLFLFYRIQSGNVSTNSQWLERFYTFYTGSCVLW